MKAIGNVVIEDSCNRATLIMAHEGSRKV